MGFFIIIKQYKHYDSTVTIIHKDKKNKNNNNNSRIYTQTCQG